MTPPKLTEEKIDEVCDAIMQKHSYNCGMYIAHSIADLRDQQWREMLAGQEPVYQVCVLNPLDPSLSWVDVDKDLYEKLLIEPHLGSRMVYTKPIPLPKPLEAKPTYHPCTNILIEGLKELPGGEAVLAKWDAARTKIDVTKETRNDDE